MPRAKEISWAQLGAELRRVGRDQVPRLSTELIGGMGRRWFFRIIRLAPVGRHKASRRRGTSPHPGKFRASVRAGAGRPKWARLPDSPTYGVPGAGDIEPELARLKPGQTFHLTDDAKTDRAKRGYADVLERGRHTDSRGRPAGSKQAPKGVFAPAMLEMLGTRKQIIASALAATLQKEPL
jgi:hypothetical protein